MRAAEQIVVQANSDNNTKTGVLLVNLGTVAAPTTQGVRKFLKPFLSDRRVINLPRLLWLPILHAFVLPFRSPKVAKLYQSIWTEQGSPMEAYSKEQVKLLRQLMHDCNYPVDVQMAMTYSKPSIKQQLAAFTEKGIEQVIICPLYPQYSMSTVASVHDQVMQYYMKQAYMPSLRMISSYHNHPAYIDALMKTVQRFWQENLRSEKLLLSFHGFPEKSTELGDPYEQQCRETAKLLVEALGLTDTEYKISFQSRFGKAPLLQPYTDDVLLDWANKGVKSVDVLCPGFAADCLETLEEVSIGYRDLFLEAGGGTFRYIPALNAEDEHIECLFHIITEQTGQ